MPTSADKTHVVRVLFGGDVMLGRGVNEAMRRYGHDYPLGDIAHLTRNADLTVVNLECALTRSSRRWTGAPKPFYFCADPDAVNVLLEAGVGVAILANNHVLDCDVAGLLETVAILDRAGISHAGAGRDIFDALSHAVVERDGIRFGFAAYCDHQADFAADRRRPGIAYLDLGDEFAAVAMLEKALGRLLRDKVDIPVLSLHWGPNGALNPSPGFRRIARAAVGMGWKILFGHSAHTFQGVEIIDGCPVIYGAGDLVDDYRIEPELANDHQLLFEVDMQGGRTTGMTLYPVFIDECRTRPALGMRCDKITRRMMAACRELGTAARREGERIRIDINRA